MLITFDVKYEQVIKYYKKLKIMKLKKSKAISSHFVPAGSRFEIEINSSISALKAITNFKTEKK
ncbi:hypothetical protein ULMS_22700 [Patiriisocius marinistellae]|uniref:Uncharacterized protein n=1 Tax=Patiriisocius marinistellae TaxID=2494560 RepID=A0A5J4FZT6_9FLAO|nr:hypothetical protein ULMS_22700 [Patiriisocius marinistellae]